MSLSAHLCSEQLRHRSCMKKGGRTSTEVLEEIAEQRHILSNELVEYSPAETGSGIPSVYWSLPRPRRWAVRQWKVVHRFFWDDVVRQCGGTWSNLVGCSSTVLRALKTHRFLSGDDIAKAI